mmetsp:Transcript_58477/g.128207  ORF Transcript_58477/g.128207 Transcript_58477/m.128207 type:complete len:218 (+) Transcript_58477:80-733(+)
MPLTLKCALVARGTFVVCEYEADVYSCSLPDAARKVLSQISRGKGMKTFVYEGHAFNYLVDRELCFICVSNLDVGTTGPYSFLKDLKTKYSQVASRPSVGEAELTRLLKTVVDEHNGQGTVAKVHRMESELDEVTELMKDNITKVMERGERIESLVDKTSNLRTETASFRTHARNAKNNLWWQNMKFYLIIVLVLTSVCVFLLSVVCGGMSFRSCKR